MPLRKSFTLPLSGRAGDVVDRGSLKEMPRESDGGASRAGEPGAAMPIDCRKSAPLPREGEGGGEASRPYADDAEPCKLKSKSQRC